MNMSLFETHTCNAVNISSVAKKKKQQDPVKLRKDIPGQ